ncbi:CBU_1063 family Dot/Icm T4SS effector [Coxiella burnetii]|uniref:CBU_1063 family Dot/Icm T4SS effector n=1 Tax=Coxiella burnetii TaxID=777 RepID=UPI00051F18C6|nr:CBU_1063 family Dot/Icm T4SS effector [Coxiella burnetii]AIT63204.1 hypothetical protein CBNA_0913 [Coxiella burnetii str. Namibia]
MPSLKEELLDVLNFEVKDLPVFSSLEDELVVLGLDIDGLIFNHRYLTPYRPPYEEKIRKEIQNFHSPEYLEAHKLHIQESADCLIKKIKKIIDKKEAKVICASTRQGPGTDFGNAIKIDENLGKIKTDSCVVALTSIVEKLKIDGHGVELDTYLLADTNQDGETFLSISREAQNYNEKYQVKSAEKEPNYFKEKFNILYAHVHRLAVENPNKKISYHFLDDREDIIVQLSHYYNEYPQLIPKNVSVTLHLYHDGRYESFEKFDPIEGCGVVDPDYKRTFQNFTKYSVRNSTDLAENRKNTTEILLQQVKLQFEFYTKLLNDKILSLKNTENFDQKDLIDKLEALRDHAVKIKHEAPARSLKLLKLGTQVVLYAEKCIENKFKTTVARINQRQIVTETLKKAAENFGHRKWTFLRSIAEFLLTTILPLGILIRIGNKICHNQFTIFAPSKSSRHAVELGESAKKTFTAG